jgi:cyclopropane fatty-acyl-phospholipid synthase-like methyltransferase
VLDVGCGRGELLDLLRAAEIPASGVDSDAGMVAHCRAKGHTVELADASDHLERLEDGSLGAIVALQVVEHMPYHSLDRFFDLTRRKLGPGGLFLFETVNPHSIRALKAFWVDPTHQHPVFPEVALALCRLHGFAAARVAFPNGAGALERDLVDQSEYAVLATTAAAQQQGRATSPVEADASLRAGR